MLLCKEAQMGSRKNLVVASHASMHAGIGQKNSIFPHLKQVGPNIRQYPVDKLLVEGTSAADEGSVARHPVRVLAPIGPKERKRMKRRTFKKEGEGGRKLLPSGNLGSSGKGQVSHLQLQLPERRQLDLI